MKKFSKVLLILICILVVIGGGILGGLYFANTFDSAKGDFDKTGTFTVKFDGAEIKSICAEFSIGSIKLVKGSDWNVRFENVFTDYSDAKLDGSELVITSKTQKDISFLDWKFGTLFEPGLTEQPMVYVTYPEGVELSDINIQLGIGTCTIKDVSVSNIVCQAMAGAVELENCRLTEKSAFQLLVGSFRADDVMFRNSSVKVGAGFCRINLDETSRKADVDVNTTLGFKKFD